MGKKLEGKPVADAMNQRTMVEVQNSRRKTFLPDLRLFASEKMRAISHTKEVL